MEIYRTDIRSVENIIETRNRVQLMCEELGFSVTDRLRVATAVFELGKWILERGEGSIVASLRTKGDNLLIEMQGIDTQRQSSPEEIEELLADSSSAAASSLKGIPAMRRLMDEIDISPLPTGGTRICLTKRRAGSSRKLAKNLVGFLQKKLGSRSTPSLYDELRLQNANLAQSLSLIEEKAQELQRKNDELNRVGQALETSNAELQEKTAELQQALLTLGDRTAELSAQNKRFTAVLEHVSQGVLVTERAGTVVEVNDYFLRLFGLTREQVTGLSGQDLSHMLGKASDRNSREWSSAWALLSRQPDQTWSAELTTVQGPVSCRSLPIAGPDQSYLGRVWIFS